MWNKFLDTFDRIRVSCLELFQETLLLLLLFGIITIFNSSLLLFHNGTLQSPPLCGQLNAHAWWTQVARQSLQSEKPENTVCFECKSKDEIHYFQRGLRECWGSEISWRRMGRDGPFPVNCWYLNLNTTFDWRKGHSAKTYTWLAEQLQTSCKCTWMYE